MSGVFPFPHSFSTGDVTFPTNTIGPIDTMEAIFLANAESSEAMANGNMPPCTMTEWSTHTRLFFVDMNGKIIICMQSQISKSRLRDV